MMARFCSWNMHTSCLILRRTNIFQNHRIFIVVDQLCPGHQDAEDDEGEPEYAHEDQGGLQQSCEEELSHLGSGSGWKVSKSAQK